MNILQAEDLVKGYPDQQLLQEAKAPRGEIPQYLLVSEIQRRADMRKRFANQEKELPQGTVADQIISGGIAALQPQRQGPPQGQPGMPPQGMPPRGMPPQGQPGMPPQGMPGQQMAQPQQMRHGGIVRLATGGRTMTIPYNGQLYEVPIDGFATPQEAVEAFLAEANKPVSIRPDPNNTPMSLQFDPNGQLLSGPGSMTSPQAMLTRQFANEGSAPYVAPTLGSRVTGGELDAGQSDGIDWQGIGLSLNQPAQDNLDSLMTFLKGAGENLTSTSSPTGPGSWAAGPARVMDWLFSENETTPASAPAPTPAVGALAVDAGRSDSGGKQKQGLNDQSTLTKTAKLTNDENAFLTQLAEMVGKKSGSLPDIADLLKQQRNETYGYALTQLGAGIAGGNTAAGLSRAGDVAYAGRQDARDQEMKQRMLQYAVDQGDTNRDVEILGKAAQIQATSNSLDKELARQNSIDRRAVFTTASQLMREYQDQDFTVYPSPQAKMAAMQARWAEFVRMVATQYGVELAPEDYQMPAEVTSTTPSSLQGPAPGWGIVK